MATVEVPSATPLEVEKAKDEHHDDHAIFPGHHEASILAGRCPMPLLLPSPQTHGPNVAELDNKRQMLDIHKNPLLV